MNSRYDEPLTISEENNVLAINVLVFLLPSHSAFSTIFSDTQA